MFNFITDSEITKKAYRELDNYKIIKTQDGNQNVCAIYFTSHDLYYPNTDASFRYSIYEKDHYEWTKCLVKEAGKHIFLRDIHKQWYLSGINGKISSAEQLLDFLKKETAGMKIISIGSSAGGYAALRFGEWLGADRVIAFSPRVDFKYLLENEWDTNPIARTFQPNEIGLLDTLDFSRANHFVFYPSVSKIDLIQLKEYQDHGINIMTDSYNNLHICLLSTSHHGIPFPKVALSEVINASSEELFKYAGKEMSPYVFAARFVGWPDTISGYLRQIKDGISKKIKQKLNK